MTSGGHGTDIVWLVASLLPDDVAPHPNFGAKQVSGPELLALIAKLQLTEYRSYGGEGANINSHDRLLLDAVAESLTPETVLQGMNRLVEIADNSSYSYAQRAAALIFAAVAGGELDGADQYTERLAALALSIEADLAPWGDEASLIAAIIRQQCAMRCLDAGSRDEAARFAALVLSALDRNGDYRSADFVITKGVSWGPEESLTRIHEFVRINALSIMVTTSRGQSGPWRDLVRSPFPLAAIRATRDSLSALTTVVDENFDRTFEKAKRTLILGNPDPAVSQLYSSLLRAELTGDSGELNRLRTTLGNVLSLKAASGDTKSHTYIEALRLLRQGRADDHLRRLLQLIRMDGPLDLLHQEAVKLIQARSVSGLTSITDLLLLDRSADLLTADETDEAIRLAIRFPSDNPSADGAKRMEASLRTTLALVASNPSCNMNGVAAAVLEQMHTIGPAPDIAIYSTLASIAASISWGSVEDDIRADWHEFFMSSSSEGSVRPIDTLRALAAIGDVSTNDFVAEMPDWELVAALVSDLIGSPPPTPAIERATNATVQMIGSLRSEAAAGVYAGRTYQPIALAAYLVIKFERFDLWPVLWDALNDPRVSTSDKAAGLRILTEDPPSERAISRVLEIATQPLIDSPDDKELSLFPLESGQISALRLQFNLAFRLTTIAQSRTRILKLAVADEAAIRAAIADACLFVLLAAEDTWPRVTLLQLSHDRSGTVRNHAAYSLGYLSAVDPAARADDAIVDRITDLFTDPGISTLLGLLQGFTTAAESVDRPANLWCVDLVTKLITRHLSRNVRRAAEATLAAYQLDRPTS